MGVGAVQATALTLSHILEACHARHVTGLQLCTHNGTLVHAPGHARARSCTLMHALTRSCTCVTRSRTLVAAHERALWTHVRAHECADT